MVTDVFSKVAVIGLGLIGGSLFHRLSEAGLHVHGYDHDPQTRLLAAETAKGKLHPTVASAVAGADLAIAAVPMNAMPGLLNELDAAKFTGLVTDVASVKSPISQYATEHTSLRWVGGHPMAGSTSSGFAAADQRLFDDCAWALCLDDESLIVEWLTLAQLICALGARVVPVTSRDHDRAVARSSHVPHVLAAALTRTTTEAPTGELALTLGAGSFRDGTRVAAAPVGLTSSMCAENMVAVRETLTSVIDQLSTVRALLANDALPAEILENLTKWFSPARQTRQSWPPVPGVHFDLPATRTDLLGLGKRGGWIVNATSEAVTAVLPAGSEEHG